MNPEELEDLLHRAHLGEPSPNLRDRVLSTAREGRARPESNWRRWLPELAAAALIVLSLGQLSRPQVLAPSEGRGGSTIAESPAGERILDIWRASFRDEPGLMLFIESYLAYLERASEQDVPTSPFGAANDSWRSSS